MKCCVAILVASVQNRSFAYTSTQLVFAFPMKLFYCHYNLSSKLSCCLWSKQQLWIKLSHCQFCHSHHNLQSQVCSQLTVTGLLSIDQWCLVGYDDKIYVGNVTDRDKENEECEVASLKLTGTNKFVKPTKEDKRYGTVGTTF